MATLAVQNITIGTSLTPSFDAAASGGDAFVNNGQTIVYFKNANVGASRTVTIASQTSCNQGETHNVTVTVPPSSEEMTGRFPVPRFNDDDGLVQMTYDSEADLTIAVISI